ncbi:MAG TPA: alpha/beta hydrolase [Fibrobacteria bacterium]|nr:alpha/beta hydrolase [Fibrobacteria bacterium]
MDSAATEVSARDAPRECVVLLHGLARTSKSMGKMAKVLEDSGYAVRNLDYPSREHRIDSLGDRAIGGVLELPGMTEYDKIHFVTHSMGGILVRSYLARHAVANLGRVVMLGPPNHGSEVVDHLRGWWVFRKLNGPAGGELGTDSGSTPAVIRDVPFDLGVIAGDRSINWINSLMIGKANDGKVSVESTMLPWMSDHLVVHATHPFMMRDREVIEKVVEYLRTGRFTASR